MKTLQMTLSNKKNNFIPYITFQFQTDKRD